MIKNEKGLLNDEELKGINGGAGDQSVDAEAKLLEFEQAWDAMNKGKDPMVQFSGMLREETYEEWLSLGCTPSAAEFLRIKLGG